MWQVVQRSTRVSPKLRDDDLLDARARALQLGPLARVASTCDRACSKYAVWCRSQR